MPFLGDKMKNIYFSHQYTSSVNCKLIQQITISYYLFGRNAQIIYMSTEVTQHQRLCLNILGLWVLT